ncbi:hypothetical protein [Actinosynnema sp.]|uniref:hypothetical protein n=1 Tax=Actinosynnema sp. TaxID=1872144 RepID=UPI003F8659D7
MLITLFLRSVLVPLKAALGFLLSIAASFGALVAVSQNGHLTSLISLFAGFALVFGRRWARSWCG